MTALVTALVTLGYKYVDASAKLIEACANMKRANTERSMKLSEARTREIETELKVATWLVDTATALNEQSDRKKNTKKTRTRKRRK
jgi:hypothetical protein